MCTILTIIIVGDPGGHLFTWCTHIAKPQMVCGKTTHTGSIHIHVWLWQQPDHTAGEGGGGQRYILTAGDSQLAKEERVKLSVSISTAISLFECSIEPHGDNSGYRVSLYLRTVHVDHFRRLFR